MGIYKNCTIHIWGKWKLMQVWVGAPCNVIAYSYTTNALNNIGTWFRLLTVGQIKIGVFNTFNRSLSSCLCDIFPWALLYFSLNMSIWVFHQHFLAYIYKLSKSCHTSKVVTFRVSFKMLFHLRSWNFWRGKKYFNGGNFILHWDLGVALDFLAFFNCLSCYVFVVHVTFSFYMLFERD